MAAKGKLAKPGFYDKGWNRPANRMKNKTRRKGAKKQRARKERKPFAPVNTADRADMPTIFNEIRSLYLASI